MGSGASIEGAENELDDKPILLPGIKLQGAASADPNLELQAAAHWHRILVHTKQELANGNRSAQDSDNADDPNRLIKNRGMIHHVSNADDDIVKMLMNKTPERERAAQGHKHAESNITKYGLELARKEKEAAVVQETKHKKHTSPTPNSDYRNTLLEGEVPTRSKVNDTSRMNSYIASLMSGGKPMGQFQWSNAAPTSDDEDDDPDRPAKWEDEEFRPDIELPLVILVLKHRSATSITISYDINVEAMTPLHTIRCPENKAKVRDPLYEVEIRASYGPKSKQMQKKDSVIPDSHRWRLAKTRVKGTTTTIENLQPNTMYEVRVCRMHWDMEWGPAVAIRTGPGPPAPPKNLHATEVASNSILLHWTAPDKDNGLPIIEYSLRCKEWNDPRVELQRNEPSEMEIETDYFDGSMAPDANSMEEVYVDVDQYYSREELTKEEGTAFDKWGEEVYRGKARLFLHAGLNPTKIYMYRVCAINLAGDGETSTKVSVKTLPEGSEDITPWVVAIDHSTHKTYYYHPRSTSVSWTLPRGVLIDDAESFKNKKIYLNRLNQMRMAAVCKERKIRAHVLKLTINRDNAMLHNSFNILANTPDWEFVAGPLRVNYIGEDGIDAGGLAKDWFVEVVKLLLSVTETENAGIDATRGPVDGPTSFNILLETDNGVTINPTAGVVYTEEECRFMYTTFGMFLGKSLIDGQTLGMKLHPFLLKALQMPPPKTNLDKPEPSLSEAAKKRLARKKELEATEEGSTYWKYDIEDLKDTEPDFYRGLVWIRDCDDVEDMDIAFSTSYSAYSYNPKTKTATSKQITVELMDRGSDTTVTNENRAQYIELMLEWLCKRRYEPYVNYIYEGMRKHLPQQYTQHFTIRELQDLIGGTSVIDPKDVAKGVLYAANGYTESSEQVKWLWSMLEDFSQELLAAFLTFVTGCPSMPIDGLRPPLLLTLHIVDEGCDVDSVLPHAHTCFNQLVFPKYTSYNKMVGRFKFALENTGTGFFVS